MVSLPSDLTFAGTILASASTAGASTTRGLGGSTSDTSPGVHSAPPPPPLCPPLCGFSVVAPQPAASKLAATSAVRTDSRVRRDTSSLPRALRSEFSESCQLGCATDSMMMLRTGHHGRFGPDLESSCAWWVAPRHLPVSPSDRRTHGVRSATETGLDVSGCTWGTHGRRTSQGEHPLRTERFLHTGPHRRHHRQRQLRVRRGRHPGHGDRLELPFRALLR